MKLFARGQSQPRSFKLLGWVTLPVLALAMFVQTTGLGIDLLVVGLAALVLFALERSLGDWLGEWMGPLAAAGVFVVFALALAWYFLSASLGRSQTDRFFVEAERRGYRTAYYQTPRPASDSTASSSGTSQSSAVSTAGAGAGPAGSDVERARPAGGETDVAEPTRAGDGARAPGARREGSILSRFRRRSAEDKVATEVALSVDPSRVVAARRAILRATVHGADGSAVTGQVEFTVNGLGAGRIALDGTGVATASYTTHLAGTYEARARFAGSPSHASSRSRTVVFTVVPGR